MNDLNFGYIALAIVGVLFLLLQVWWIGMTMKNVDQEEFVLKDGDTDEFRTKLEKLYRS